ncbi:MAG: hypothetical protein LBN40_05220 [Oscillospiraceae bacterium]|jgi:hypothetical protein|nr:hypothetical protein [Oscillospiraceae bacterium]
MARSRRSKKKKREFSKLHVVFADSLVAVVFIANIILSLLDKMPISDLSVAIVTIYGGFATGGYFALCGFRDASLNKHGLRIVNDASGNDIKEEVPNINTGGSVG